MKTVKGKMKSADAQWPASTHHWFGRLLALSVLPLAFTACVHWPDIATDCESYGVTESSSPLGSVVRLEPLNRDQLNSVCGGVDLSNSAYGTEVSGCVIAHHNGLVDAYYWVGDRCAMNHEMCHAKHGPGHTERYLQELKEGGPMPYCPPDQLTMNP